MKRLCSVMLVVLMLCSVLAVAASAEETASLTISAPSEVEVGDTVSVSVSISTISDSRSIQMTLNYDSDLLTYVNHSSCGESNHKDGRVIVFNENTSPKELSGTLVSVTFTAKAAGTATFSLSNCVASHGIDDTYGACSLSTGSASTVIGEPHVCAPKFVE